MTQEEISAIEDNGLSLIIGHYKTLFRIHYSPNSIVYVVEDLEDSQKKVLKLIRITDKNENIINNEIYILDQLKGCPYIIQKLDSFIHEGYQCIVTQYAEKGSVYENMVYSDNRLNENATRSIIRQILLALQYMHNLSIAHRDIKPENIFVLDWNEINPHVVLGDLGLATCLADGQKSNDYAGTSCFMAPEIELKQGHDKTADIWELGCTLHYLLFDKFPLPDFKTHSNLYKKYVATNKLSEYYFKQSPYREAHDLFLKMCKINPSERISIEDALRHPWLDTGEKLQNEIISEVVTALGQPNFINLPYSQVT